MARKRSIRMSTRLARPSNNLANEQTPRGSHKRWHILHLKTLEHVHIFAPPPHLRITNHPRPTQPTFSRVSTAALLLFLTCVAFPRSEFHVQNVVGGALPRDMQPVRVNVGRVGVFHGVPLSSRIRPAKVVRVCELVRLAGFHADRGPRDLRASTTRGHQRESTKDKKIMRFQALL